MPGESAVWARLGPFGPHLGPVFDSASGQFAAVSGGFSTVFPPFTVNFRRHAGHLIVAAGFRELCRLPVRFQTVDVLVIVFRGRSLTLWKVGSVNICCWSLICLLAQGGIVDERVQIADTGCLMICGGGRLPASVTSEFVQRAGGKSGHLVVIPTASTRTAATDLESLQSLIYPILTSAADFSSPSISSIRIWEIRAKRREMPTE